MRRTYLASLLVGAALFSTSSVFAETNAASGNTFSVQNGGMSFDQVRQAANQGDPDAQYALGYLYFYGKGTQRDVYAAKSWISKAAAQGQPQAIKALQLLSEMQQPGSGPASTSGPSPSAMGAAKQAVVERATAAGGVNNQPSSGAASPGRTSMITPIDSSASVPQQKNDKAGNKPQRVAISNVDQSSDQASADQNATPSVPAATTSVINTHATTTSAKHKNYTAAERALLATSGHRYTIQLMGSYYQADAIRLVKEKHLGDKAKIYRTYYQDHPWYVLVYGIYSTDKQAAMAIKKLPASVQKLNPWVKSLTSVQKSIQMNGPTTKFANNS